MGIEQWTNRGLPQAGQITPHNPTVISSGQAEMQPYRDRAAAQTYLPNQGQNISQWLGGPKSTYTDRQGTLTNVPNNGQTSFNNSDLGAFQQPKTAPQKPMLAAQAPLQTQAPLRPLQDNGIQMPIPQRQQPQAAQRPNQYPTYTMEGYKGQTAPSYETNYDPTGGMYGRGLAGSFDGLVNPIDYWLTKGISR